MRGAAFTAINKEDTIESQGIFFEHALEKTYRVIAVPQDLPIL